MAKTTSGMSGVEQASRMLRQLPDRVEDRVLQNAAMAGARAWAKHIRTAAPVGEPPKSKASKKYGPLKKNIKVRRSKTLRRKHQRGASVWTAMAFWGYIQEFGSRYLPANPWFRPAAERGQKAALNAQAKNLEKGIDREVKKLARQHGIK